jgi:hypothetical protein
LTLLGAQIEATVDRLAPILPPNEGRKIVDQALGFVKERHPGVPFMYATLYLVRAEVCKAQGDANCMRESVAFLCERSDRLALPGFINTDEKKSVWVQRAFKLMDDC